MTSNYTKVSLQPFIKWPGGKQEELKVIIPSIPEKMDKYIEPFVGGGAVYFAIRNANEYLINDRSQELIGLYNCIKTQNDEFFNKLGAINHSWGLLEEIIEGHSEKLIAKYISFSKGNISDLGFKNYLVEFIIRNSGEFNRLLEADFNINLKRFIKELKKNLINKTKRMKRIEKQKGKLSEEDILDNLEAAFKSGFYMHFRYLYNNIKHYDLSEPFATAIFYFIREYCYSSMFRYNKSGGFNVPYGGISYNRKNFKGKIDSLEDRALVEHLNKTTIKCLDFENFLNEINPSKKDFMFLDPPYDSDFSTYANIKFVEKDQVRLANYLKKTKARFMLVIKNTEFIYSLYKDFNIKSFDKKYLVSFKNRNDRKAKHLLITNY